MVICMIPGIDANRDYFVQQPKKLVVRENLPVRSQIMPGGPKGLHSSESWLLLLAGST